MWPRLFFLGFIQILASTEVDPLTQIAQAFFKEDLFYAHLKSEFVNKSIDTCDNFYRRLCPRDLPEKSWIWNKINAQIKAVMEIKQFLSPIEEDLTIQRIEAGIVGTDTTNYQNKAAIFSALKRVSLDTLLVLMEAEQVFNNRGKNYHHLLRKTFQHNQSVILEKFADKIHLFMISKEELHSYTDFNKIYLKIEQSLPTELTMLQLVQRRGLDHKAARERIETLITNIIEEYLSAIKANCDNMYYNAPWSTKEDRFGYTQKHILSTYINQLGFAVAFANRYSISDKYKDSFAVKYRNLFLDRYRLLSDMSHMPQLRIFFARSYAARISLKDASTVYTTKLLQAHMPAFSALESTVPDEIRMFFEDNIPSMVVVNHIFSIHVSFSAQTASLIGFTGFVFAHEMYHQVQFANYRIIEDLSDHQSAENCVIGHTNRVCARFTERACSSGQSLKEDAADVYGVQIVYKVLQKMMEGELDRIVFPDLNMTNRELFYHTLATNVCVQDLQAQWMFHVRDPHNGWMYRVNGLLGQLPDFKRTFGCFEDDRMVFPENSMCPVFSEGLARRR